MRILVPLAIFLTLLGCAQSAKVTPEPEISRLVDAGKLEKVDKLEQAVTQLTETVNNQIEEKNSLRSQMDSVSGNVSQSTFDISEMQSKLFLMLLCVGIGLILLMLPINLPDNPWWLKIVLCIAAVIMLCAPLAVLLMFGIGGPS